MRHSRTIRLLIAILAVFFSFATTGSYAQRVPYGFRYFGVDVSRSTGIYYGEEPDDNIGAHYSLEDFFAWTKEASDLFRAGVQVNEEYNKIFVRHFGVERAKKSNRQYNIKYIALPMLVKVYRYDFDIRPLVADRLPSAGSIAKPSAVTYFTPVLEGEEDVLYVSEMTEDLLTAFIEEPYCVLTPYQDNKLRFERRKKPWAEVTEEDRKERKRRLDMVWKYIPAFNPGYSSVMCYLTNPRILEFAVGRDGYYLCSFGTGIIFGPWNGEPELLGELLD